jgi:hypothetical protein
VRLVEGRWEQAMSNELVRGDVFEFEGNNDVIYLCLDNPYYSSDNKVWHVKYVPADRKVINREFPNATKEQ